MRTLFALLTLCITALSFAAPTHYRDEDNGLVMTIPEGFEETWSVHNHKSDFDVKIFNTAEDGEEVSIIGIAKVPSWISFEDDVADLIPALFENIQDSFDDNLLDDVRIKFSPMPSLVSSNKAQAYHIEIISDDLEDQVMQFDFHLFFENSYVTTIITGGVFNARFTDLTKQVLANVRFIQE